MKANIIAACAALLLLPQAARGETPKWKDVANWKIHIDTTLDNGCFMASFYDEGYAFRVGFNKGAANGYMMFGHKDWKSLSAGGNYDIDVQFGNEKAWAGRASGVDMSGLPTLMIAFDSPEIMQQLANARGIRLSYDDKEIASLALDGSRAAVDELIRCQRTVDQAVAKDPFAKPARQPAASDPFRR